MVPQRKKSLDTGIAIQCTASCGEKKGLARNEDLPPSKLDQRRGAGMRDQLEKEWTVRSGRCRGEATPDREKEQGRRRKEQSAREPQSLQASSGDRVKFWR